MFTKFVITQKFKDFYLVFTFLDLKLVNYLSLTPSQLYVWIRQIKINTVLNYRGESEANEFASVVRFNNKNCVFNCGAVTFMAHKTNYFFS